MFSAFAIYISTRTASVRPLGCPVNAQQVSGDWPMFHLDPAHSGASTGNPVLAPTLLWKYILPTHAKYTYDGPFIVSSPAAVGGMVYVGAEDDNVYALNATNGNQIWIYTTGGVYSSPAVVGGVVYVGSEDGNFYALNATDGTQLWNHNTGGIASSPAVISNLVYVCSDEGTVYALNAINGTQLWKYKPGGGLSSPAVANCIVYIGSVDANVYALSAVSGTLIWKFYTGSSAGVLGSVAVADGVVYTGTMEHNFYALNASNGNQIWNYNISNLGLSTPAYAFGVVYFGAFDYNVYALNATSGIQIWSYATENSVESSPAVVNGVVYIGSNDATIYAIGGPVTSSPPLNQTQTSSLLPAVPELPSQTLGIMKIASLTIVLTVVIIGKKRKSWKIQRISTFSYFFLFPYYIAHSIATQSSLFKFKFPEKTNPRCVRSSLPICMRAQFVC